jgi:hypothetical protein
MGSYTLKYKGYDVKPDTNYNVPLAFLFVGGFYIFVVFILLIRGFVAPLICFGVQFIVIITSSVKDAVYYSFLADSDNQYEMAEIVFAAYDHSITDPLACHLKQIGLAQLVRVCRRPHYFLGRSLI